MLKVELSTSAIDYLKIPNEETLTRDGKRKKKQTLHLTREECLEGACRAERGLAFANTFQEKQCSIFTRDAFLRAAGVEGEQVREIHGVHCISCGELTGTLWLIEEVTICLNCD